MNDLVNTGEDDVSAIVLATANGVLESISAFPASGCEPTQDGHNIESHRRFSVVTNGVADDGSDLSLLCTYLGNQLRVNALNLESQLATKGNAVAFSMQTIASSYGFTRSLHLNEQGEVTCIVGAFVGNAENPIVFDPESPLVLEILARDSERSLTDRVRILSQLVCLYSDAIRFAGFSKCPLGDAVRLLRLAVSKLREYEASNSSDGTDNPDTS